MKYYLTVVLLVTIILATRARAQITPCTASCTDTSSDTALLGERFPTGTPIHRVTVPFNPGETCLVSTPLVVNTQWVSIEGNGATLDCSHLGSGTCLTFTGSGTTFPGFYNQNMVKESGLELVGPGGSNTVTGVLAQTIDTQIENLNVHGFNTCYNLDGPNSFLELFLQDEGWNCVTGINTGTDSPSNSGELIRWIGGGIFNSTNAAVMQNTGGGYELDFTDAHFDGLTGSIFILATASNSTAEVEVTNSHIEYSTTKPTVDMVVLGGNNKYTWFRSVNTDFQVDGTNVSGAIHSMVNASGTGWANIIAPWMPINSYAAGGGEVIGSGAAGVIVTGGNSP